MQYSTVYTRKAGHDISIIWFPIIFGENHTDKEMRHYTKATIMWVINNKPIILLYYKIVIPNVCKQEYSFTKATFGG